MPISLPLQLLPNLGSDKQSRKVEIQFPKMYCVPCFEAAWRCHFKKNAKTNSVQNVMNIYLQTLGNHKVRPC